MTCKEQFDKYEEEINRTVNDLVGDKEKEKGYTSLKQILRNYDYLVKKGNFLESFELPYWCYCCCSNEENNND